jgi:hypothetical protein
LTTSMARSSTRSERSWPSYPTTTVSPISRASQILWSEPRFRTGPGATINRLGKCAHVARDTRSSDGAGYSRVPGYAARVIPWIIFALVVIPLLLVGFVATRCRSAAGEERAAARRP